MYSLFASGLDQAGNLINGLVGAINLAISEDGRHLYIAGLGNNVTVFSRDLTSVVLSYLLLLS